MNKRCKVYILCCFSLILCLYICQYINTGNEEDNEHKYIEQIEHSLPVDYVTQMQFDTANISKENTEFENSIKTYDNKHVTNVTELKGDEDCILYIDEIDFAKIVYTGSDRMSHLEKYDMVTATDDMRYTNGGNYIICGHASRLYGHSLNRLKEVKKGNHIRIRTNKEVIGYIVDNVFFEKMDNTESYCKQSDKDEVTIISCAKYISPKHYIIVHGFREK